MNISIEDFDWRFHDCCITVLNHETGNHRTFKIGRVDAPGSGLHGKRIVSVLVGSDDWRGFGFADVGAKSIYLWARLRGNKTYEKYVDMIESPGKYNGKNGVEYMIEGKCRKCGRPLTNPESIKSGMGPICSHFM